MTVENIFQYTFDGGAITGIVIADNLKEAVEKVREYIKVKYSCYMDDERGKALLWSISDIGETHQYNDVYELT